MAAQKNTLLELFPFAFRAASIDPLDAMAVGDRGDVGVGAFGVDGHETTSLVGGVSAAMRVRLIFTRQWSTCSVVECHRLG